MWKLCYHLTVCRSTRIFHKWNLHVFVIIGCYILIMSCIKSLIAWVRNEKVKSLCWGYLIFCVVHMKFYFAFRKPFLILGKFAMFNIFFSRLVYYEYFLVWDNHIYRIIFGNYFIYIHILYIHMFVSYHFIFSNVLIFCTTNSFLVCFHQSMFCS